MNKTDQAKERVILAINTRLGALYVDDRAKCKECTPGMTAAIEMIEGQIYYYKTPMEMVEIWRDSIKNKLWSIWYHKTADCLLVNKGLIEAKRAVRTVLENMIAEAQKAGSK